MNRSIELTRDECNTILMCLTGEFMSACCGLDLLALDEEDEKERFQDVLEMAVLIQKITSA